MKYKLIAKSKEDDTEIVLADNLDKASGENILRFLVMYTNRYYYKLIEMKDE